MRAINKAGLALAMVAFTATLLSAQGGARGTRGTTGGQRGARGGGAAGRGAGGAGTAGRGARGGGRDTAGRGAGRDSAGRGRGRGDSGSAATRPVSPNAALRGIQLTPEEQTAINAIMERYQSARGSRGSGNGGGARGGGDGGGREQRDQMVAAVERELAEIRAALTAEHRAQFDMNIAAARGRSGRGGGH